MSNLFSIKRYVPLETIEGKLVGEISKLITTPTKYIIFDNVSMQIFIFDKETGKTINVISAMGQGPKEYTTIWDIAYRELKDEILILSPQKILTYTSKGVFKQERKVNLFASNMSVDSSEELILYADYSENRAKNSTIKYNLLQLNDDYSIEKQYMRFDKAVNSFVRINPLIDSGQRFLYYEKKEDIFYNFNVNNSLKAKYYIDYGNNNFGIAQKIFSALENDKTMSPFKAFELEKEYGYCSLVNAINLESTLFLVYSKNDYFFYSFYDKEKHTVQQYAKKFVNNIPPIPFENDLDGVSHYFFVGGYEDTLIAYALPEELIHSDEKGNDKLNDVRSKIEEGGNYVIVEFELKK